MRLFADTANMEELKKMDAMGLLEGITTNPTIASQAGKSLTDTLKKLSLEFTDIEVFGQVVAKDTAAMVEEARKINQAGAHIVVKIPCTPQGLAAVKILVKEGIHVCVTAVLTAAEAYLCAVAGADYVAPYTGQNDLIGFKGTDSLADMCEVIQSGGYQTQVLAASVEKPQEMIDYALAGADVITVPYHVIEDTFAYTKPLTDLYVDRFFGDWSKGGCEI